MSGAEKRRYRRVHFRGDIGDAIRILGARVAWPNHELSDIFDLSCKGLAAARPALVDLKTGSLQGITMELGDKAPFLVAAKVVWTSEQLVGMELMDLSAEAHLRLREFMSDKLVGQHLRSVDRQFFAPDADFNHWFQGPNGVSLFLWCSPQDASHVVKVRLEWEDIETTWEFENGRVTKGEEMNERAVQILGQILVTQFRLKDIIEKVAAA